MIHDVTSKGLEAQLKAELRANELGFIVSKPTTECCRYDMIIDDGHGLKRIQVKFCDHLRTESEGAVEVSLRKTSLNRHKRPYYTESEIDGLIVYVKPIERLCYFPIELIAGKQSLTLRFETPKNNQTKNVFLCEDYYW